MSLSSPSLQNLSIKIFADGADTESLVKLAANQAIKGFTTNPTLMRKAGVQDYERFALEVVAAIGNRPVSFEVFADEFAEMERQAHRIAAWGNNVFVKIPITNTKAESSCPLIRRLAHEGLRLNVTALTTIGQVHDAAVALDGTPASFISVFAGRVADTGVDPVPLMAAAVAILGSNPALELIWASPRELLNVFQANTIGCHAITVTPDILTKMSLVGKNLDEYSLDTVRMFYEDGRMANFSL